MPHSAGATAITCFCRWVEWSAWDRTDFCCAQCNSAPIWILRHTAVNTTIHMAYY